MGRYDDIINLPYRKSTRRPHMSMHDRAAQFAPFAALTGHGEAIDETARFTDRKIEPSEDKLAELNNKISYIRESLELNPQISVTYFIPDESKQGGKYVSRTSAIDKLDDFNRRIRLSSGEWIEIDDILNVEIV